jgi:hypothetical protein
MRIEEIARVIQLSIAVLFIGAMWSLIFLATRSLRIGPP